jgi:hypothetical protein
LAPGLAGNRKSNGIRQWQESGRSVVRFL